MRTGCSAGVPEPIDVGIIQAVLAGSIILPSPIVEEEKRWADRPARSTGSWWRGRWRRSPTGFQARLEELGYTPLSTVTSMRLMVHLSRWLGARGLTAADLTSQRVEQYLRERRAAGYARFLSPRSVAVLLGLLSSTGGAGPSRIRPGRARNPRRCWPRSGTTCSTSGGWRRAPRRPMCCVRAASWTAAIPGWTLAGLTAADVTRAVLGEAGTGAVGSTQFFVVALRAFLRFCFIHGLVPGRSVRGGVDRHRSPPARAAQRDQPGRGDGPAGLL